MKFHVEPLSDVLATVDEVIRDAAHAGGLRDRLKGVAARSLISDAFRLQVGLDHYLDEFGLTFVSSIKSEGDTLLVFSGKDD